MLPLAVNDVIGNSVQQGDFRRHGVSELILKKFHFPNNGIFYLGNYFQVIGFIVLPGLAVKFREKIEVNRKFKILHAEFLGLIRQLTTGSVDILAPGTSNGYRYPPSFQGGYIHLDGLIIGLLEFPVIDGIIFDQIYL